MNEALALTLMLAVGFACGLYWGWVIARHRQTPITTQSIEKYIEDQFPDLWSAYKKGVFEGYEQGLRDGQEPFA
jgi:hypothetical protein